jgi:cellulose synthase/poly-beta-1,6-N-acetylglucosamine synthase-like glycosyltransferase
VRVCVPCYKEPMSVIEKTVNAALDADLPTGTKRTVYLCDDGNMDEKRVFAEDLQRKGRNIVYVRDRPKHLDGEWQCTIHVAGYLVRDTAP